jgi:hypothetical protein
VRSPFLQYQERFKPGMPSQICKIITGEYEWAEADRRLLEAVKTGVQIKDWMQFWRDIQQRDAD